MSPSTCWKWTKTAGWAPKFCWAASATARRMFRRTTRSRTSTKWPSTGSARHGIHRYEISNFARPGFESLHNLKYWKREPYIGFGADAHSFDGRARWQNVESAQDYVAGSERGEPLRCGEPRPIPTKRNSSSACGSPKACTPTKRDWRALRARLRTLPGRRRAGARQRQPAPHAARRAWYRTRFFQEFIST